MDHEQMTTARDQERARVVALIVLAEPSGGAQTGPQVVDERRHHEPRQVVSLDVAVIRHVESVMQQLAHTEARGEPEAPLAVPACAGEHLWIRAGRRASPETPALSARIPDRKGTVMAQVNVYVPDALKAELEAAAIPLSGIAQGCWRRELRRALAAGDPGEFSLDAIDSSGADVELRFKGEDLGSGVYRTDDGKAVVVDTEGSFTTWTPEKINEHTDAFADEVWTIVHGWLGGDGLAADIEVAAIVRAFGARPVINL